MDLNSNGKIIFQARGQNPTSSVPNDIQVYIKSSFKEYFFAEGKTSNSSFYFTEYSAASSSAKLFVGWGMLEQLENFLFGIYQTSDQCCVNNGKGECYDALASNQPGCLLINTLNFKIEPLMDLDKGLTFDFSISTLQEYLVFYPTTITHNFTNLETTCEYYKETKDSTVYKGIKCFNIGQILKENHYSLGFKLAIMPTNTSIEELKPKI